MAIIFHPNPGQILLCDCFPGFKEPEMVKTRRPVIVLTGPIQGRAKLVTIAPFSTVEPVPSQLYHYKIPKQSMPMLGTYQNKDSWLKSDMIYTVGFHRLNLILLNKKDPDGKRLYFKNRFDHEQMKQIYQLHSARLKFEKINTLCVKHTLEI